MIYTKSLKDVEVILLILFVFYDIGRVFAMLPNDHCHFTENQKMLRSPLFRFHPRSSILKFTTTAKPKTAKSAFTAPKATEPSSGVSWFTIAAITALAGAGYYVYETQKAPNYQAIYNDIANVSNFNIAAGRRRLR